MDSISIIFLRFDYTLEKKIRIFLLLKFATFGTDIVYSAIGRTIKEEGRQQFAYNGQNPQQSFLS